MDDNATPASDSSGRCQTFERLVESNARLIRLLELARADIRVLENEVQSSQVKIAGLLAGLNYSSAKNQASGMDAINVMLQAIMSEHHANNVHRRSTDSYRIEGTPASMVRQDRRWQVTEKK